MNKIDVSLSLLLLETQPHGARVDLKMGDWRHGFERRTLDNIFRIGFIFIFSFLIPPKVFFQVLL